MPTKTYHIQENEQMNVSEPAVAYHTETWTSNEWNPNVPFHGTQEEWLEHFRRIEEGEFMTIEEADKEFETWKTQFLVNRI